MSTAGIKAEDIVRCDVRGDRFWAIVTKALEYDDVMKKKVIRIASLTNRPIPTQTVTGFQIIGHWRKKAGSKL